jgi:hypothetical protein
MPSRSEETGDESLKRLGGGRWQTRDERFTIEPQSGTWAVVDAEETDDLGLPLVRGPFRSLTDAKAAIATARTSDAPASPLAERLERRRGQPPSGKRSPEQKPVTPAKPAAASGKAAKTPAPSRGARAKPAADESEEEPGWMRDLAPAERGRARRLIERLTESGESDAVGIVRRDLVGDVPAIAAHAISKRLAELPEDAAPATVAELLADGRDDDLGVRWRIVDGDGRPILVDVPKPRRGSGRG